MISDLKSLTELLKLCRSQGVTEITVGGCAIKFGEMPQRRRKGRKDADAGADDFPHDGLSPEDMIFYSVTAPPEGVNADQ